MDIRNEFREIKRLCAVPAVLVLSFYALSLTGMAAIHYVKHNQYKSQSRPVEMPYQQVKPINQPK